MAGMQLQGGWIIWNFIEIKEIDAFELDEQIKRRRKNCKSSLESKLPGFRKYIKKKKCFFSQKKVTNFFPWRISINEGIYSYVYVVWTDWYLLQEKNLACVYWLFCINISIYESFISIFLQFNVVFFSRKIQVCIRYRVTTYLIEKSNIILIRKIKVI